MNTKSNIVAAPLPKSREAMIAQRTMSTDRTLNDYVDDLHVELFVSEEEKDDQTPEEALYYYKLLEPVFNSMAVEGSLQADDFEAARVIRGWAKNKNINVVARQNLETIKRSLHVVWRRYKIDRKQRRITVHGQTTADEENGE